VFGYVDALREAGFRLILADARGHGGSDKPHDPATYHLDRWVTDITTVLDALNLAKVHFWGYSMGGWIGFGMAKYEPERVDRLVIGGSHPYARNQEPAREFFNAHLDDSADWAARSACFRERHNGHLGLAYGERPRERLDLFLAGNPAAPTLAYIHAAIGK
jgi:pimeloyl-ACP methyl ester carboxylesterase